MSKILGYIKKYDILVLLILGIIFYFPSLFYDFVGDDIVLLIPNQYINGSMPISFFDFFKPNYIMGEIYTPLTFIIYWLIIKIFGISSFALHFVNIIFYILSSIALFYLLKKIINNYSVVFFAIVLYILHPCHIECTVWISGLGYNISAFFFFLSFLYFIIAFDEDKKLNYIFSVLFYVLAILSQPIAIVLPAILFLWVFCFRRNILKKSIGYICFYVPFLLLYVYLYRQTVLKDYRFDTNYNLFEKISILGFDFFNSFFPVNLCPVQPMPSLFFICSFIVCIILLYLIKDNVNLLFFSFWGIISILPYSNVFFNMVFPLADRYLLLFSVSTSVIISYFSFSLFDKFKNKKILKYLCFIFFLMLYSLSFISYIPIWKNNTILHIYTYNINPDNPYCAGVYAQFLIDDKKYDEAMQIIDKIISKNPSRYDMYDLKIKILIEKSLFNEALDICFKLKEIMPEYYKTYLSFFDIYMYLQDYDNASKFLDHAYIKAKEHNLYKNDKIELFANKRLLLSYVNADVDNYIDNFKIISNNCKLLNDNGKFLEILNENDYKIKEMDIIKYLNNYNTQYSRYITNLLSCLYMKENYKEEASKVMKSLLKEMSDAQKKINEGDNNSAEKIYLSIISQNKYMYEAYYNLGFLYLQTNRSSNANKIFEKILKINPNDEQIKQIILNLGENIKQ